MIWDSSAGILSPGIPSLALFLVTFKAHLTSHSMISHSGSRWVTTQLCFSRTLRALLYSSSAYSHHLFLISSASVRSLQFLFFIMPILAWNIPFISPIFLKGSLVFPFLLFSAISWHCSFKKAFLSLHAISGTLHSVRYIFPFLPLFLLLFFSQLFVKPYQTTNLSFCISFSLG